ncbi:hypothetical protein [Hyphomonas jannaschiana]|uniref:Uncharacterized protein n=1 Tax=Hyphomonas jannaschiana VP2 TaxID=1280952 RepID=A0A059FK98_9PROT|nr:hypothetical protein [Hyphomonas jannaschiana]KCZ90971.1 hypothetical protein HJA_00495 [Hyphomonas jannaschiana VP2]
MADGEARADDILDAENAEEAGTDTRAPGRWQSFRAWRQTPFVLWALAAFAGLTALVFWHTFSGQPVLQSSDAKLWFLSGTVVFWLPLILLLRDSPDNFAHGPSLRLPAVCVGLLVCLSGGLAAVTEWGGGLSGALHDQLQGAPFIACVFAALALAFLPLAWNAVNLSRFQAAERRKTDVPRANIDGMNDSKDAEAMGALVATLVVGSIIVFAICAGIFNESVSFDNLIGIAIGFLVVGAFAVVVFMDPLSQLTPVRWLSRVFSFAARGARPLAAFYDAVDTFLVRIVAVMTGMEHRSGAARYGILGLILISLCLLGWYLPPKWGLIPCALGIVAAVSVSRLWSWVEDDRALAALTDFKPTTPYRTSMREDYRDETLLGFLFVFFLIPIMMSNAHWSGLFGPDMFQLPKGQETGFLDWFGYFGVTLIKAVPIVDWAEIYNFGQPRPGADSDLISMNTVASQHAVFMARSTVDLVLIASLLQAISITGRNRQQKRLYKAGTDPANKFRPGLIDRLDTFVEKAELRRTMMACLRPGAPWPEKHTTPEQAHKIHFNLNVQSTRPGLVDFRRYNADRLGQMHGEYKDPVARAFIAAISVERPDFDLTPRLVLLDNMAEKGAPESDLYTMLDRISTDLSETPANVHLTIEVLRSILFHTARRAGLREFKQHVIRLLATCQPDEEVIEALADIAGRSNPDAYQYTKVAAIEAIDQVARRQPTKQGVRAAMAILKQVQRCEPGAMTGAAIRRTLAGLQELLKSLKS